MMKTGRFRHMVLFAWLLAGLAFIVAGCTSIRLAPVMEVPGGDPQLGATLLYQYGCGSCHTIPGVRDARGLVGPPLTDFASRAYIAGQLTNNTDNLIRWIMNPEAHAPGTAMPDLHVSEDGARHMAAYLYTLQR